MKTIRKFLAVTSILFTLSANAAIFKTGEEVIISKPVDEDLYVAGETITIDAVIGGDLIAAGGVVTVNDTITEDLTITAGDVVINAYVGDDARIFGENIKIQQDINGDVIVFGAYIQIDKGVTINGDLIIFAGQALMNGTVNGKVKLFGGELSLNGVFKKEAHVKAEELRINGIVEGTSELAANTIELGENSQFYGKVEYWQREGEINFDPYMRSAEASYNEDLMFTEGEVDWEYFGLSIVTFWILYTLSVWLTLILLVFLFSKAFSRAGDSVNHSYFRNFGYGAAYFIGLPLLTAILFITLIGIPIGLLTLNIYGLSLLFAFSITSVILAYGFNARYNKNWNKWRIIVAAAIIFLLMKLITLIPFIGWLVMMIIVGLAFGALLSRYFPTGSSTRKKVIVN